MADVALAYVVMAYRADWEPAASSGRRIGGVPGVLWRCPAGLWAPYTSTPAWVGWKTRRACGNGVDLPHVAKHTFGDQTGLGED